MVKIYFIEKILKSLERYMLRKNGFRLKGENYELILLLPSDKYVSDSKYSLLISAKILDNYQQKDMIRELLIDFKETLQFYEYNLISRINIIHSNDPFVKNLILFSLIGNQLLN